MQAEDIESGKIQWRTKGHSKYALDISYSKSEKLIASSGADGNVAIFNLQGELQKKIPVSNGWVREVCFSNASNMLVAGTENGELYQIKPKQDYTIEKIRIEPL